jgi:hypothetical protein
MSENERLIFLVDNFGCFGSYAALMNRVLDLKWVHTPSSSFHRATSEAQFCVWVLLGV